MCGKFSGIGAKKPFPAFFLLFLLLLLFLPARRSKSRSRSRSRRKIGFGAALGPRGALWAAARPKSVCRLKNRVGIT
jgi:hypothetical protein